MSIPRLLALVAVAALVVWGLVAWLSEPTDEDQIREQITSVIEGAREANLGKAIAPLSDSYLDADGLDKNAIRGLLFQTFAKRGALSVLRGPMSVSIAGDTATASFDVLLAEQAAGTPLPVDGDALSFSVQLSRATGSWLITGHERQPLEEGWRLPTAPR